MKSLNLQPCEQRILHTEQEQKDFGAACAGIEEGGIIFLEGELGSGKTTFAQGVLEALGFGGAVTSPTYALMHIYPTTAGNVLHVDAYRVRDKAELYDMGLDDYIQNCRLSLIEWGENFYQDYPEAAILRFEHRQDSETRLVARLR